ncbi:mycofactocin biosynthesis glycosyltransferase MftF [Microbacterium sp.]|uniref:mycofactocin biosynthesis glycosyltransferase MftF n=1 Tax=Microbacterium sp. TaxID=51671 RepID=UPI0037CA611D
MSRQAWRGLPDGFTVRLDRHTRVAEDGAVLVGGTPTRVARLKPPAAAHLRDGAVVVRDAASAALAEHLMTTGMADPVASTLPPVGLDRLTVVVPVRDRPDQLRRLLASLPAGLAGTIVVDDGSRSPEAVARVARDHRATLITRPVSGGPAAARNDGLRRVETAFVAFVDSDAVVDEGCFETLLRHFADLRLALVAPRVLGLETAAPNWITRYENARSSLDLGRDAGSVRPRSRITWLSSTCVLARVDVLRGLQPAGFDGTMHVAEDVDLVWRLVDAGHRVRFDPTASVRHEHRTRLRRWLARKFFYGTGAEALARRHPGEVAPVVLPPWGAVVLIAAVAQRQWSAPLIAVTAGVVTVRIARRLPHVRQPWRLAARLTGYGLSAVAAQGVALLVRHWWPLTAVGVVLSRRMRRAAVIAAVADAVWEYLRLRPDMDPVRFAAARRLDDLAYGAGVWWGALRGRSVRALLPAITGSARRSPR